MAHRAAGTFEVKLKPKEAQTGADPSLGRITIDKTFQGDLEGTSKGQMLTARTSIQGSAGYVAIERVTGSLHGRRAVSKRIPVPSDASAVRQPELCYNSQSCYFVRAASIHSNSRD